MNKKILKLGITIYVKIINLFRKTKMPEKQLDKFKLPIDEFNNLINTYEYKMDPLGGLIDIVGNPDDFFDKNKTSNRDCDNFANVICINGILNGYKADEYIICNPESIKKAFSTMHVIALLEKNNEYILANYKLYKGFKSKEDALDFMKNFPSYKNDRIIIHSREIKIKEKKNVKSK